MLLGSWLAVPNASPARPMAPTAATSTMVRSRPVTRDVSVPAAIIALARPRPMCALSPFRRRGAAASDRADDSHRRGLMPLPERIVAEDLEQTLFAGLVESGPEDVAAEVVDVDDGDLRLAADQRLHVSGDAAR